MSANQIIVQIICIYVNSMQADDFLVCKPPQFLLSKLTNYAV